MGNISFNEIIGFILVILFAIVMGISMQAILVGDYMQSHELMSVSVQQTLRIAGFAGALAALLAWWTQRFAATRGFVVRFLFALFFFIIGYFSFGAMLRLIYTHLTYPNQQDWSLTGLYFASVNDFYTFVVFMLGPSLPALVALLVAAGAFIGLFGPRESQSR